MQPEMKGDDGVLRAPPPPLPFPHLSFSLGCISRGATVLAKQAFLSNDPSSLPLADGFLAPAELVPVLQGTSKHRMLHFRTSLTAEETH